MHEVVPDWVCRLRDDIEDKVYELGVGYGIPIELVKDSKNIEDGISSIVDVMKCVHVLMKDSHQTTCIGYNGVEFNSLMKKSKNKRIRKEMEND